MKVFDLRCAHGHLFEGWFASHEDYQGQLDRGLLECPLCGNAQIEKALSAPHLKSKSNRRDAAQPGQKPQAQEGADAHPHGHALQAQEPREKQARWLAQVRELLKQGEDVGERFAQEVRRIHEGEADERPIHGQASAQEIVELLEDGIPVLPLPDVVSKPLQ